MLFATVSELSARLEWDLDEGEVRVAEGALEALTYEAIEFGSPTWTTETVPAGVKSLVLTAAARYMRNYNGYNESRAGDETVGWGAVSREPDTAEFTESERRRIKRFAINNPGFGTIDVYTWGTKPAQREDLLVPMKDRDLPWINADEREWYEGWPE